ncbi:V-type H+-transporting ATPase 16kDa proteolipid subunit [Nematocida major]|uniref:V-type H+-transporting ATPase 16kDa proteolipid subunit n=1 Tax=Nematocida major TaxID=1912982 RepID=UPI002007FA49|nr:V-type H+-transporting ATPase 16kDa proteolipid subunit [Nematocida major]KAH9385293.1 V-type H+-transporting ATPase 16kDa proteolipid subunit [Nematocida major]
MLSQEVFDKDAVLSFIYPLGMVLLMVPAFAGVSIGMGKASHGVCQAAAVKNDVVLTIIPAAFIGVGVLYAGLLYFIGGVEGPPISFEVPLRWLAANIITGFGIFWGSLALGDISAVATVTAAQQKRFKMSFFLLMVFGEFIGLFSLIIGVILLLGNKQWIPKPEDDTKKAK